LIIRQVPLAAVKRMAVMGALQPQVVEVATEV
jgi:hypothetical protein